MLLLLLVYMSLCLHIHCALKRWPLRFDNVIALCPTPSPTTPSTHQLSEAFKDQWAKFTRSSPEEASQAWDALVGATDEDGAAGRVQRAAQYVAEKGVVAESSTAFYFNGRLQRRHGDWQTSLIVPALYEMQFLQVGCGVGVWCRAAVLGRGGWCILTRAHC